MAKVTFLEIAHKEEVVVDVAVEVVVVVICILFSKRSFTVWKVQDFSVIHI